MKTMIFPTNNEHSVCATWQKEQVGHSAHVEPVWHERDDGICTGMVLVWLKKSIAAKGLGICHIDELGDPHLMAIVHGAYSLMVVPSTQLKHEVDILNHMLISQSLTPGEGPMSGEGYFDPAGIVDWALQESCHCIFSFGAPLGARNGYRHVIGLRYENQVMEMLDPNEGLFQYPNIASFKEHMETVCYQENADCLGGEWAVVKATSAID